MTRPRYYIQKVWSDTYRAFRWVACDGDASTWNDTPVGGKNDISFADADDALTFCKYLNDQNP